MAELVEPQVSRYQEYKSSGVEWLGDIPSHWKVNLISRLCHMGRGRVINHEYIHENPGNYPIYSSQTLNDGVMGLIDTYDFDGEYVTWTTDGANAGTVSYREGKFSCTNVCGTLRPKASDIYLRFLPYILNLGTKYSVRFDINPKLMNGMMGRIAICVPPLEEQQAIVQFLDDKTAQLDQLIAQKQQMLELLREERAALINHAVTKGMDPQATLRDSGVAWLGEVPAHWEVKRLKFISPSISVGLVINPSTYHDDNGTVPMISGKNVTENGIDIRDVKFITEESSKALLPSKLNAGDLVSIRVGYPGLTAVVPEELDGINCASVMIIRKGPGFHSPFLSMLMNSQIGMQQVDVVAYGSAQKQFNVGHAIEFVFPLPPLEEQLSISEEVNRQEGKIAETTDTINQEITLLQEYRAALIAEAVTGQLDVRHYVPVPAAVLM